MYLHNEKVSASLRCKFSFKGCWSSHRCDWKEEEGEAEKGEGRGQHSIIFIDGSLAEENDTGKTVPRMNASYIVVSTFGARHLLPAVVISPSRQINSLAARRQWRTACRGKSRWWLSSGEQDGGGHHLEEVVRVLWDDSPKLLGTM